MADKDIITDKQFTTNTVNPIHFEHAVDTVDAVETIQEEADNRMYADIQRAIERGTIKLADGVDLKTWIKELRTLKTPAVADVKVDAFATKKKWEQNLKDRIEILTKSINESDSDSIEALLLEHYHKTIKDLIPNRPDKREKAYEALDEERQYQNRLGSNRTDGSAKTVGDYIVMLSHYQNELIKAWTVNAGTVQALDVIRKIGGIAIHAMEDHGIVRRQAAGIVPEIDSTMDVNSEGRC